MTELSVLRDIQKATSGKQEVRNTNAGRNKCGIPVGKWWRGAPRAGRRSEPGEEGLPSQMREGSTGVEGVGEGAGLYTGFLYREENRRLRLVNVGASQT